MPTATQGYAETFDLPQQAGLAATTQDKVTNLSNKVQEKVSTLSRGQSIAQNIENMNPNEYRPAMLESLGDADTPRLVGQEKAIRLAGDPTDISNPAGWLDARETWHGQYSETPKEQARLDKQREMYGFKDQTEVLRAGERDKLEQLYNLMGRPIGADGKEWTPGPVEYDPRTEKIELGSRENPLNIPVSVKTMPGDAQWREVSYVADASRKYDASA